MASSGAVRRPRKYLIARIYIIVLTECQIVDLSSQIATMVVAVGFGVQAVGQRIGPLWRLGLGVRREEHS